MMRTQQLILQRLEVRDVPATFGIPWTEPTHLTMSFSPDQTVVTTGKSTLFQTLNAQYPTVVWQRELLRAAQTWASAANLEIGLVSDNGAAFGSNSGVGPTRVNGDIRIGAVALAPTALAIGLPPDPFFGDYWSGEVVYNSTNKLDPAKANLYSVFLHEFGHALGLPSTPDPLSVMFNEATTPATGLSAGDIVAIRSLYGVRQPDLHDAEVDNSTFDDATNIEYDDGPYTGQFPLIGFGAITSKGDVDTYRVETPLNYSGPITFQLRSRGLSLLAPKLSVYDRNENLLGLSLSLDPAGDTVTVHLSQSLPNTRYYLKVEGAATDSFGVGRFGVAITFDTAAQPVYVNRITEILTGPYEQLDGGDLAELMLNPGTATFNDDSGNDDSIATAVPLTSVAKLFETVGVVETATDVDVYRIRTPLQSGPVVLTISVRADGVNEIIPKVELVTPTGTVLSAEVLFNGDGRWTAQARGLSANSDYYVRVRGATPTQLGNYHITVLASADPITPLTFGTGAISTQALSQQFVVVQNQVFHFLLSVRGPMGSGARFMLTNPIGEVVYDITAMSGSAANARPVLLKPGIYRAIFTRIGISRDIVTYFLRGAVLSDPIGPGLNDPTQSPAGPDSSLATYYFLKFRRWTESIHA